MMLAVCHRLASSQYPGIVASDATSGRPDSAQEGLGHLTLLLLNWGFSRWSDLEYRRSALIRRVQYSSAAARLQESVLARVAGKLGAGAR